MIYFLEKENGVEVGIGIGRRRLAKRTGKGVKAETGIGLKIRRETETAIEIRIRIRKGRVERIETVIQGVVVAIVNPKVGAKKESAAPEEAHLKVETGGEEVDHPIGSVGEEVEVDVVAIDRDPGVLCVTMSCRPRKGIRGLSSACNWPQGFESEI